MLARAGLVPVAGFPRFGQGSPIRRPAHQQAEQLGGQGANRAKGVAVTRFFTGKRIGEPLLLPHILAWRRPHGRLAGLLGVKWPGIDGQRPAPGGQGLSGPDAQAVAWGEAALQIGGGGAGGNRCVPYRAPPGPGERAAPIRWRRLAPKARIRLTVGAPHEQDRARQPARQEVRGASRSSQADGPSSERGQRGRGRRVSSAS